MNESNDSGNLALTELLERLTLGVSKSLEKRLGVCDVVLKGGNPTERHQIVSWEQRNACMLPDDLKNFYLTTDGLLLTWSVCIEENKFPVGKMELNPFSKLVRISSSASSASTNNTPSLADAESCCSEEDEYESSDSEEENSAFSKKTHRNIHFDGRSRIFELENCQGFGKVCLVYLNTSPGLPAHKPEIWFLDRSLMWHFLASDFTSYYRLMLMHLGLPQWHFALTDIGLSLQAKQWFNLYAPVRLSDDEKNMFVENEDSVEREADNPLIPTANKIDFSKLFKGKASEKLRTKVGQNGGQAVNKRKSNIQSFSSSTSIKSMNSSRSVGGRLTKPWT